MIIGLMHLHRTLAYLVFLVALADLVLALSKARSDATFAKVLRWCHGVGLLWGGRVTLVAGIALAIAMRGGLTGAAWAVYGASILLWGPVEVLGKRLVLPEIAMVEDGGAASGRLLSGTAGQLLLIAVIFGLMSS